MQLEIKSARVANWLAIVVSSPKGRIVCSAICTLHSCPPYAGLQYKKCYFHINIHIKVIPYVKISIKNLTLEANSTQISYLKYFSFLPSFSLRLSLFLSCRKRVWIEREKIPYLKKYLIIIFVI